ncbi:MAG: ferredoxin-type protein NapG [Alphaproteobacteria bacterium]|nr:ferredoxin-type protein NapG [Alphaproteobacteria bacterium]
MDSPIKKPPVSRRKFLQESARGVAGVAACGVGLLVLIREAAALPAHALRPPGALAEPAFQASCVRCGLCVRACPYNTLKLADLGAGPANGTPYFIARQIPCEMCDDIPCVRDCPTGALSKSLTRIDDAKMGIAVIVSRETCLNILGLRCDVCYRDCPAIDKAITLEEHHNERTGRHAILEPTIHAEHCTGCGKCEKSCVLDEAAIKVLPVELASGKIGAHFRLGWEEKKKKGEALVPGLIELPKRMPEGGK